MSSAKLGYNQLVKKVGNSCIAQVRTGTKANRKKYATRKLDLDIEEKEVVVPTSLERAFFGSNPQLAKKFKDFTNGEHVAGVDHDMAASGESNNQAAFQASGIDRLEDPYFSIPLFRQRWAYLIYELEELYDDQVTLALDAKEVDNVKEDDLERLIENKALRTAQKISRCYSRLFPPDALSCSLTRDQVDHILRPDQVGHSVLEGMRVYFPCNTIQFGRMISGFNLKFITMASAMVRNMKLTKEMEDARKAARLSFMLEQRCIGILVPSEQKVAFDDNDLSYYYYVYLEKGKYYLLPPSVYIGLLYNPIHAAFPKDISLASTTTKQIIRSPTEGTCDPRYIPVVPPSPEIFYRELNSKAKRSEKIKSADACISLFGDQEQERVFSKAAKRIYSDDLSVDFAEAILQRLFPSKDHAEMMEHSKNQNAARMEKLKEEWLQKNSTCNITVERRVRAPYSTLDDISHQARHVPPKSTKAAKRKVRPKRKAGSTKSGKIRTKRRKTQSKLMTASTTCDDTTNGECIVVKEINNGPPEKSRANTRDSSVPLITSFFKTGSKDSQLKQVSPSSGVPVVTPSVKNVDEKPPSSIDQFLNVPQISREHSKHSVTFSTKQQVSTSSGHIALSTEYVIGNVTPDSEPGFSGSPNVNEVTEGESDVNEMQISKKPPLGDSAHDSAISQGNDNMLGITYDSDDEDHGAIESDDEHANEQDNISQIEPNCDDPYLAKSLLYSLENQNRQGASQDYNTGYQGDTTDPMDSLMQLQMDMLRKSMHGSKNSGVDFDFNESDGDMDCDSEDETIGHCDYGHKTHQYSIDRYLSRSHSRSKSHYVLGGSTDSIGGFQENHDDCEHGKNDILEQQKMEFMRTRLEDESAMYNDPDEYPSSSEEVGDLEPVLGYCSSNDSNSQVDESKIYENEIQVLGGVALTSKCSAVTTVVADAKDADAKQNDMSDKKYTLPADSVVETHLERSVYAVGAHGYFQAQTYNSTNYRPRRPLLESVPLFCIMPTRRVTSGTKRKASSMTSDTKKALMEKMKADPEAMKRMMAQYKKTKRQKVNDDQKDETATTTTTKKSKAKKSFATKKDVADLSLEKTPSEESNTVPDKSLASQDDKTKQEPAAKKRAPVRKRAPRKTAARKAQSLDLLTQKVYMEYNGLITDYVAQNFTTDDRGHLSEADFEKMKDLGEKHGFPYKDHSLSSETTLLIQMLYMSQSQATIELYDDQVEQLIQYEFQDKEANDQHLRTILAMLFYNGVPRMYKIALG